MECNLGHEYRLQRISEIQKLLENERDKRQTLSKKYHRVFNIVSNIYTGLITVTIGLGVSGIGLLSTIIAAPVVVAMEATALGIGLLSIGGSFINKKLSSKAEIHLQIKIMAESSLATIQDLISKALIDDSISDEEFSLIASEFNKFNTMKEGLKLRSKKVIEQECEETTKSFSKMFEKNAISTNQNNNANMPQKVGKQHFFKKDIVDT